MTRRLVALMAAALFLAGSAAPSFADHHGGGGGSHGGGDGWHAGGGIHPDPRFGIGAIAIRGIILRYRNARFPGEKLFSNERVYPCATP